ncbi:response regulator transcription factor [Anaerotaenia torta]|uniref:response regulator transcription factor n=1 Tax=Anaerotaenia torta TaxID=433293 RepID=UPI003D21DBBF
MYSLIIVEDDENIRSGLVHLFPWNETGFSVVADFSNGSSAWQYLKSHQDTCAVLTDVRMPLVDGLELSRLISENYPLINVILISGYRDFTYAQQALRYNVRDFLVKPIKYPALMIAFLKLRDELNRQIPAAFQEIHPNQYYERIIHTVKAYLMENLSTATLEEAAMTAHLSSSYLSRLFKSRTGCSFSEYLLQKRMERACVLLSNTGNKIYEISDEIGYDSPKNFSRTFRNYYNISPKEYRERGGQLP